MAMRKAAGLSQAQLAELIGEGQRNIAYWEVSDHPPRSDVLPALAKALSVSVEDILNASALPPKTLPPNSRALKLYEELSELPRRQQDKVYDVLNALIRQFKGEGVGSG